MQVQSLSVTQCQLKGWTEHKPNCDDFLRGDDRAVIYRYCVNLEKKMKDQGVVMFNLDDIAVGTQSGRNDDMNFNLLGRRCRKIPFAGWRMSR